MQNINVSHLTQIEEIVNKLHFLLLDKLYQLYSIL